MTCTKYIYRPMFFLNYKKLFHSSVDLLISYCSYDLLHIIIIDVQKIKKSNCEILKKITIVKKSL